MTLNTKIADSCSKAVAELDCLELQQRNLEVIVRAILNSRQGARSAAVTLPPATVKALIRLCVGDVGCQGGGGGGGKPVTLTNKQVRNVFPGLRAKIRNARRHVQRIAK